MIEKKDKVCVSERKKMTQYVNFFNRGCAHTIFAKRLATVLFLGFQIFFEPFEIFLCVIEIFPVHNRKEHQCLFKHECTRW